MVVRMKLNSSFSGVSTCISSAFRTKPTPKLNARLGPFDCKQCDAGNFKNSKVVKKCQFIHGKQTLRGRLSKKECVVFATSEDEKQGNGFELDDFEDEQQNLPGLNTTPSNVSDFHTEEAQGRPGFISFYRYTYPKKDIILPTPGDSQKNLLWFLGPTVLVASFIFPSLYLRRLLTTIFEDSLLTDFLILFFTEALFYSGVAVFLLLIDHLRRPTEQISAASRNLTPYFGQRVSSVTILVLSLIIPMVTMGFVWPWTGPAASATLAPYLVGIVVQFAFEQYGRHIKSPSWPVIPILFQVYRLHQLNRAAQLVTALSFTVRGAEMTSHNIAINGSLNTLLNVLQFLGVICIWSLSSFVMRYFPSDTTCEQ